jgi:DNA-binding phage protein
MGIAETLKAEIARAPSLAHVSRGAGVTYGNLYRFYHHGAEMQLANLERLAEYFGLRLVKSRRAGSKPRHRV